MLTTEDWKDVKKTEKAKYEMLSRDIFKALHERTML